MRCSSKLLHSTLTPFLYPCLNTAWVPINCTARCIPRLKTAGKRSQSQARSQSTVTSTTDVNQYDHLDPTPPDYSSQTFTDACSLTISAGAGGHGCISFLREKFIANGPPNGGDGGTGGSVYIQAVRGETSLHKIARRGILKAARGKNGQGSLKGGARGEDILVTVPVGTVVREVSRYDPLEEDEALGRRDKGFGADMREDDGDEEDALPDQTPKWRRDKWLIYPGTLPRAFSTADFPALPRPRRNNLTSLQPPAPLHLDLDKAMNTPILLAAGAMGGLGNPHFVTKSLTRPKFATKGDDGMRVDLQLELKLLADVGLVGLPNAGKSTLLRALTKSRTRVGNWAFTTLSPNVGTVVLDTYTGRPILDTKGRDNEPRTNFTIADIPGLIEDAHLDRGLGLGFLRHIERAAVLAFVVDLSAGDAALALQTLWREVGKYEELREQQLNTETMRVQPAEEGMMGFKPFESSISPGVDPEASTEDLMLDPLKGRTLAPLSSPPISSKPWLVIATKADLPGTEDNFKELQSYLGDVQAGACAHPSGKKNAWRNHLQCVPVSAMNKEGVANIPAMILRLLGD